MHEIRNKTWLYFSWASTSNKPFEPYRKWDDATKNLLRVNFFRLLMFELMQFPPTSESSESQSNFNGSEHRCMWSRSRCSWQLIRIGRMSRSCVSSNRRGATTENVVDERRLSRCMSVYQMSIYQVYICQSKLRGGGCIHIGILKAAISWMNKSSGGQLYFCRRCSSITVYERDFLTDFEHRRFIVRRYSCAASLWMAFGVKFIK